MNCYTASVEGTRFYFDILLPFVKERIAAFATVPCTPQQLLLQEQLEEKATFMSRRQKKKSEHCNHLQDSCSLLFNFMKVLTGFASVLCVLVCVFVCVQFQTAP